MQELSTYLLAEVANLYRTNFEKAMSEIGLHSGQVFVLDALYEINGASQKELAEKLNLSAPTINTMVRKLEDRGFVESSRCERDARSMRVYLTGKAVSQKHVIVRTWREFDASFLASLTDTEQLMFFQLLEKIRQDFRK